MPVLVLLATSPIESGLVVEPQLLLDESIVEVATWRDDDSTQVVGDHAASLVELFPNIVGAIDDGDYNRNNDSDTTTTVAYHGKAGQATAVAALVGGVCSSSGSSIVEEERFFAFQRDSTLLWLQLGGLNSKLGLFKVPLENSATELQFWEGDASMLVRHAFDSLPEWINVEVSVNQLDLVLEHLPLIVVCDHSNEGWKTLSGKYVILCEV